MVQNKDEHRKQLKLITIVIIFFCFLLYGNSFKNNYALDDNYVTATSPQDPNPRIQKGLKGIPELFTSHYIESNQQDFGYRPVVLTTFAIEYQFFGSNPHISHFVNVSIYALTNVLLFVILFGLLSSYHIIFPLLITFLFIAHPIHTEVVNNLKSRDELLSFLFGICSLYFFLKRVNEGKLKYIFLAISFLLLALLSKKTAILFFALIPLTLYFFTSIKIKKLLIYVALPIIAFVGFKVLKFLLLKDAVHDREFAFFENPLFFETDFLRRIPFAIYTAGYYIKLLVFPHPLSCYYGYNTIPYADWSFVFVWGSLLFHFAIGIYALLKLSQKSIISYAIIIYLIGVFPFSNVYTPVVGIVGERFIYFASLGFCIAIAYLLFIIFKENVENNPVSSTGQKCPPVPVRTGKNFNSLFKTIVVLILAIFSIKTFTRNPMWKDVLTLFRQDVSNFENSCNLNYILANALVSEINKTSNVDQKNKLINEAKFHYKKTTELMSEGVKNYPEDYTTLNNLATIYVDIFNDATLAQPYFKKVIIINPNNKEGQYNFGYCYEKRNIPDSAIFWYEKMLSEKINYFPAYQHLHELYYKNQDYEKAILCNKKAIELFPEKVALYINVGNSYMLNSDTLTGLKYFEDAAAIPPLDYVLLQNVANVFKATGDTLKAMKYEEKSKNVMRQSINK